jgi:FixJ family two-component response regulator
MSQSLRPVVFLIDDDDELRESLAAALRSAGYIVRAFNRPSEFLQDLDLAAPGVLVLDVRLPEMSGLELQTHLHRIGCRLPVLLITSHADIPMVVSAMRAGARDFLEKPVQHRDLIERVAAALREDAVDRDNLRRIAEIRARHATLSPREKEVMQLVVDGRANKVIALDLGLSERTVEVHRGNIMDKMAAQSLAHLVKMHMALEE